MKWINIVLALILIVSLAVGIYFAKDYIKAAFDSSGEDSEKTEEKLPPWKPMDIVVEGGEVKVKNPDENTPPAEEEIPSEYAGDEEMYNIDSSRPVFVLPEDFS